MSALADAIAAVPPGGCAVAVSGGADSVALLRLLHQRRDLSLHIVHLDHQTRGQDSTDDARFVEQLARELRVPGIVALRHDIELSLKSLPQNPSARYRTARLELYRQVVTINKLAGVILAHHADDQAETVLQRLIRGASLRGLCGMGGRTRIGELLILRPLLSVDRQSLREYLHHIGQSWREDASNQSEQYLRNRLRRWLRDQPEMRQALLELAAACRELRDWTMSHAPRLEESFRPRALQGLAPLLARESARQWLLARGVAPGELTEASLDRLIEMACDAASPSRQTFAGDAVVRRAGGRIFHWKTTTAG